MGLLFLLLLLVIPHGILSAVDRWSAFVIPAPARARVGLSLLFAFAGVGHFVVANEMVPMLPPFVPYRLEIIYLSGVLEILGALGVWVPGIRRLTGLCLILLLIGVLPSNIYAALQRVPFGGHDAGPVYLLARIPLQMIFIGWTYFATEQKFLSPERPAAPRPAIGPMK